MKKLLVLVLCLTLLGTSALAATPITWLTTGDAAAKPIEEGDRIIAAINEKFDIDLNVEYVPEGSVEKVNVQMASGDLPDIVTGAFGTSATQSWIENGMVIPLNDYLDDYPNLAAWLKEYTWTAIDGQYYGIPFISQYSVANSLIMMRGDWLEKLGLSYPTNLDEMAAVLHAFTYDDPDGDGQDNTYGITGVKPLANLDWPFFAYGIPYSDYGLDADGNVVPWFESEGWADGMRYVHALWEDGVIDREFMLNDNSKAEEKFYQGKAGAYTNALYRHVARHINNLKSINENASLAYGLPPVGPDGVSFGLNKQGKTGFLTCVTVTCPEPEKALAFLDFMVSEEGNNLVRLGIEGVHYSVADDGSIVYHEEERMKDAFSEDGWAHALAWGSLYWPLESGYYPSTAAYADEALETVALASEAQKPELMKKTTDLEIEYGSELTDIYNQYFLDMMTGDLSVEEGLPKLSAEWRSQGGEALLEELNEIYHSTND